MLDDAVHKNLLFIEESSLETWCTYTTAYWGGILLGYPALMQITVLRNASYCFSI
jgi:hypothetical protein